MISLKWGLLIYLAVVTAGMYVLFAHQTYDDPFITYRYADNLASGQGFVYNPGERVLSTTTPLFTLLLAGGTRIGLNVPGVAKLIGTFSLGLGGICLWLLARQWNQPWAGWAGLLLFPSFSLLPNTLGSETPLYLAFCLGSFVLFARRQYAWMALCAALAVLTRPDGALAAVILAGNFLFDFVRSRRSSGDGSQQLAIPWRAIAIFLAVTLAWIVFAWGYFGSPLPATLAAKQAQGTMAGSQRFVDGFVTLVRWFNLWPYWLAAGLAVLGLIFIAWRARSWFLLLGWTAFYFAGYAWLGVSGYFWYYAPLVPGFVSLVGLGIEMVARIRLPKSPDSSSPVARHSLTIGPLLATGLLVGLFVFQVNGLWLLHLNPDARYPLYRDAGLWLEENTPCEASVGALEVGIIGYYARRPMVDFAGLIQPEVAAQLSAQTTYEDAALWAVAQYHPAYLALFSGIFPDLEQGFVTGNCQPVKVFSASDYQQPQDLVIYDCR